MLRRPLVLAALAALMPGSAATGATAASSNVVELEHLRITVLTGALLRIELRGVGAGGGYDDRPTLSFPYLFRSDFLCSVSRERWSDWNGVL